MRDFQDLIGDKEITTRILGTTMAYVIWLLFRCLICKLVILLTIEFDLRFHPSDASSQKLPNISRVRFLIDQFGVR